MLLTAESSLFLERNRDNSSYFYKEGKKSQLIIMITVAMFIQFINLWLGELQFKLIQLFDFEELSEL